MASESPLDVAGRFLNSRDPAVLLSMPGCAPLVANEAHDEFFGRHTWDDRRKLYLQSVGSATEEVLNMWVCYCEKVRSVLALREMDCLYERAHQVFASRVGRFTKG